MGSDIIALQHQWGSGILTQGVKWYCNFVFPINCSNRKEIEPSILDSLKNLNNVYG